MEDFINFWGRNADEPVAFAMDRNGLTVRSFKVLTLGQTAVINRQGQLVYNGLPLGYDGLRKIVERII